MARKQYSIGLSVMELACIDAAATDAGITRTAWLRKQALRAAKCVRTNAAPLSASPPRCPSAKVRRSAHTHLTEEQFAALAEHARACDLTVAAFMREVLMGYRPVAHRHIARSAIVAVNRAAKELHQLVQLANSGTLLAPDLMRAVTGLLDAIPTLRDALLVADEAASGAPEPAT